MEPNQQNKINEQKRTRDMEIKNKLDSDQKGGERILGERRRRVRLRNMHKGPMDKDNGLGMSLGVGVGRDRGEQQGGKNWDNCN